MKPPSAEAALAFCFSFLLLSFVFMGLRGYGRMYKQKSALLLSDYLLFIGWAMEATNGSLMVIAYTFGEVSTNDLADYPITKPSLKVSFAISTLYDFTFFFPKASILMFYYRLIPITNTKTRIALHAATAYTIAAFFITFGLDLFSCIPVSSNWSLDPNACRAFLSEAVFRATWSLNLSSDLAIFVVPLPIAWNLRVAAKEKARVVAIFALGIITMTVSIARFVTINIVLNVTSIYMFSSAEANIALIVAALPTLNLFFKGNGFSGPRIEIESGRTDSTEASNQMEQVEFCTVPLK